MNRRLRRLVLLLGLTGLVSGCGSGSRLPCPGPGSASPALDPGQESVSVTLRNDTCMSLCVLMVSPDHCEYMGGPDYLQDHPLASGESISLQLPPGNYATWIEYCSEEYFALEHLKVKTDDTWTLSDNSPGNSPPCGTSLTVVNHSPVPVCSMWIGVTESVYTGWNWIGAEQIEVGASRTIVLRPGSYFIRAEACDGTWLRADTGVQVSGHQTWTVP